MDIVYSTVLYCNVLYAQVYCTVPYVVSKMVDRISTVQYSVLCLKDVSDSALRIWFHAQPVLRDATFHDNTPTVSPRFSDNYYTIGI